MYPTDAYVRVHVSHLEYLHVGNQTCYTYTLFALPRGAAFSFTLSSGNQHLTHLQRVSLSGRLHSGTCFGDEPFLAKVRRARQAPAREVSLRRRLRHLLQHQGHRQPQSKSLKAELRSETASLKPPPAPSAQGYLGTLSRYSDAISSSRFSPTAAKTRAEMQGPARPNTSLLPAGPRDPSIPFFLPKEAKGAHTV